MHGHPGLGVHVTRTGHGPDAGHEISRCFRQGHRVPAILAEGEAVLRLMRRGFPAIDGDAREAAGMLHRRAHAIQPATLVLAARRGEGAAGKLFGIEAVIAFLRAVLTLGQGAGQGFGLEIIAETRHIARGGA